MAKFPQVLLILAMASMTTSGMNLRMKPSEIPKPFPIRNEAVSKSIFINRANQERQNHNIMSTFDILAGY